MRRFGLAIAAVLMMALGGCTRCGGWDKFNLPYGSSACDDSRGPR